jgi:hypothetical protein
MVANRVPHATTATNILVIVVIPSYVHVHSRAATPT